MGENPKNYFDKKTLIIIYPNISRRKVVVIENRTIVTDNKGIMSVQELS